MEFVSRYVAHTPDTQGNVQYSAEENRIWSILYARQEKCLVQHACDDYLQGLAYLEMSKEKIPQLPAVTARLQAKTGWQVVPVAALISARAFFELLSTRRFPAATFIRNFEQLDYVTEPDIFHELFGHCPMLVNPVYAAFVHDYACQVLKMPETDWPLMQRLFWFTVEFGLIQTTQGIRAYGGGILSSPSETVYSVESDVPVRALFNPVTAFRTPYRIDTLQRVYFVIHTYQTLYDFVQQDVVALIHRARELGELPPLFPVDENNPCMHIHAC